MNLQQISVQTLLRLQLKSMVKNLRCAQISMQGSPWIFEGVIMPQKGHVVARIRWRRAHLGRRCALDAFLPLKQTLFVTHFEARTEFGGKAVVKVGHNHRKSWIWLGLLKHSSSLDALEIVSLFWNFVKFSFFFSASRRSRCWRY